MNGTVVAATTDIKSFNGPGADMKRWLLTLPVLLGGILGLAQADYVIVVANVGGVKTTPDNKTQPGGFPGDLAQDNEVPPRLIVAVVELAGWPAAGGNGELDRYNKGQSTMLRHRWGGYTPIISGDKILEKDEKNPKGQQENLSKFPGIAFLYGQRGKTAVKTPEGQLKEQEVIGAPLLYPVARRYELEHTKVINSRPTTKKYLDLAEWALQHGLPKKYEEVMDKLAGDIAYNKEPPVIRYVALKQRLSKALPDEPNSGWYAKLRDGYKRDTKDMLFYTIYHPNLEERDEALVGRKTRLEEAFRTWYYWWSLKGAELPLPEHRLVVFLVGPDEFLPRHDALTWKRPKSSLEGVDDKSMRWRHQHCTFTTAPIVADGFLVRRTDLAVLCYKRTDTTYEVLDSVSQADDPKRLLKLQPKDRPKPDEDEANEIKKATYALLLRELEEEGERAGVSHNASRQLLFATGLMPRNVAVPEWIQFGVGSFFETPLGAPWACPTDLSPLYFPTLKEETFKANSPRPEMVKLLRSVVTDSAFRQSATETNKPLALHKARANAWALTYFLLQAENDAGKPPMRDGLFRYGAELAKLPRDREIDEETLLVCFAKAFGAWDPRDGVKNSELESIAVRWFKFMIEKNLEADALLKRVEEVKQTVEKVANTPPLAEPIRP
jgi:hypothetical protein